MHACDIHTIFKLIIHYAHMRIKLKYSVYCFLRHKGDIGAVGPNLSGGLTVIAPAQDVAAWPQMPGHFNHIANTMGMRVAHAFVTGRGESRLAVVVTATTVATGRLGARHAGSILIRGLAMQALVRRRSRIIGSWNAARAQPSGWNGDATPHGADRVCALADKFALNGQHRAVLEDNPLLVSDKVERDGLEALFGQIGTKGAETVRVSAPVIVFNLPGHLGLATDLPLHTRVHGLE